MNPTPSSPEQVAAWMRDRFGLAALRTGQAEVVHAALRGRRALFVAPTGHGKSLCYQALAASPWTRGVVLVFSPLKALMAEQEERARQAGLRASLLNSDLDGEQQRGVLEQAVRGALDLLLITPERLGTAVWRDHVPRMAVKGVIIDEAHCISQWGHDFRPWYRRLVQIMTGLGLRTPVLAVTATAPPRVIQDVREQIAPRGSEVFVLRLPSTRENIGHDVWTAQVTEARLAYLAHAATKLWGKTGIAYFPTIDRVEQAARWLSSLGVPAIAYHSQVGTAEEKAERLARWRSGEAHVVCATSALGMGVDHPTVRWILHAGMPSSLVQYVQEIGRAGRDGVDALAIAVHDPSLRRLHEGMIRRALPADADVRAVAAELERHGARGRTPIVTALDLPAPYVQRILDDLVEAGAATRQRDKRPYVYARGSGPVPAADGTAARVRTEMLNEAWAWPADPSCRRVALARAMGDAHLPAPCGGCDRCERVPPPDVASWMPRVQAFLDGDLPRLSGNKIVGLSEGLALSTWGEGPIGRAVESAKATGRPSDALLQAARSALSKPPYAGEPFVRVLAVPPTHSGGLVLEVARALGAVLGVPTD